MKLLLVLSAICMYSCGLPYCKKVKLTNHDLEWVKHYAKGDSLYFILNDMEIDTMIVQETSILNPKNTFIFDTEGCNWLEGDNAFYGTARNIMTLRHNGKNTDVWFEITRREKDGDLLCNIIFGSWSWSASPGMRISPQSYPIKNKRYTDCIVVGEEDIHLNKIGTPIFKVSKLVWSKRFGLLMYEIDNRYRYIPSNP